MEGGDVIASCLAGVSGYDDVDDCYGMHCEFWGVCSFSILAFRLMGVWSVGCDVFFLYFRGGEKCTVIYFHPNGFFI